MKLNADGNNWYFVDFGVHVPGHPWLWSYSGAITLSSKGCKGDKKGR